MAAKYQFRPQHFFTEQPDVIVKKTFCFQCGHHRIYGVILKLCFFIGKETAFLLILQQISLPWNSAGEVIQACLLLIVRRKNEEESACS
jgi:hypothetical protein